MIHVSDLHFSYPTQPALSSINFNIPAQSITALVGPNGSGKTTLLECLAGLRTPQQGKIVINNLDIIAYPREAHRFMGFLPDFFGLYDELTVKQSMLYFAMAQGLSETTMEETSMTIIDDLGLTEKWNSRVSELSRGMRQRLAIGQVLLHNPKVLLLDEPASGLDPEARSALAKLFVKLNASGMTIVVSSHILSELDQYANNLLIIRDGKVVEHQHNNNFTNYVTYVIELATSVEMPEKTLEAFDSLKIGEKHSNKIEVRFDTEKLKPEALLNQLVVEKQWPVSGFSPQHNTLESQYLLSINQN